MIKIDNKEINSYKSKLKRIRVSMGLTQNDLAKLSGINIKSIAAYEQNPKKINKASVESAIGLADCLCCTVEDIIERKYIIKGELQ